MHVVTDEHGNVIHSHHTHPHTHTVEHSHEHVHREGEEENHEHQHGEGHGHTHDHCHSEGCEGCGGCADAEAETIALVTYMADHNKHHALELMDLAKKLKEQGKAEAAEQLDKAVSEFESGNVRLNVALSLLKN